MSLLIHEMYISFGIVRVLWGHLEGSTLLKSRPKRWSNTPYTFLVRTDPDDECKSKHAFQHFREVFKWISREICKNHHLRALRQTLKESIIANESCFVVGLSHVKRFDGDQVEDET